MTLFLEDWYDIIKERKTIVLFRSPMAVSNSLWRRSYNGSNGIKRLKLMLFKIYYTQRNLGIWKFYNRKALEAKDESTLFINIDRFVENPNAGSNRLESF